jgi:tetratricopeptide (TPR) repeat protein
LAGRKLHYLLLIALACTVAVLSVLFLKSARKTSTSAGDPAHKTSSITVETGGPKACLAGLEPIRVRLAEAARKSAAGEFEELSPEQHPDMSDADLAKTREVVKVAAQKELAAMQQAFRTPEEYAKGAFEFENQRATTVAFAHYVKAAELKPDLAEAHAGLGRTLQLMGHTKEAITAFDAAVRLAPSRPGWPR